MGGPMFRRLNAELNGTVESSETDIVKVIII
jgi:hypothetical protein